MQAYPRAETKWRRDDAALPGSRVSHNHLEGKHVVEIRCVQGGPKKGCSQKTKIGHGGGFLKKKSMKNKIKKFLYTL